MGKYGGFAKEHLPSDRQGVPCSSCGVEVNTAGTNLPVTSATCWWCVNEGPAGQRKSERLAKRKSGLRK